MRQSPTLEAVWPEVRRRLLGFLHRRGLSGPAAEDVVQEVAVRLLARQVPFSSASDLMRWAVPVARNLAIDAWRRESRADGGEVDGISEASDVDRIVEQRLRLEAVSASWSRLSERDQQALRLGVQGTRPSDRREGLRLAAQRHAARARLTAMVDGTAGFLAWLASRFRRRNAGTKQPLAMLAPAAILAVVLLPYTAGVLPESRSEERLPLRRAPLVLAGERTSPPPPAGPSAAPSRGTSPRAPGATDAPRADPLRVPYGRIEFAKPSAPLRYVEVRPKRPDDHLLCVTDTVLPDLCADLPPPLPR